MPSFLSRRKFIDRIAKSSAGVYIGLSPIYTALPKSTTVEKTLPSWQEWKNYSDKVKHPCLTIKKQDLNNARENINLYGWAKDYVSKVNRNAKHYHHLINAVFLTKMIEETTPGDPLYTPCPSCRDQGKPVHPHGLWTWKVENPDQLTCSVCRAIFPNDRYPENIVFHTKWGKPQTISYCGGDTFTIFGYKEGRPSFTANIRARKVQWMANYCHTLAEAYTLTGNIQYATSCKDILLRFADCYPNWLVHVGYGEYADMDPRIASRYITNLPEPEICPPPNKPDKSLWTGYWTAGRASGVGLESDFVRNVVAAYDLTVSAKDAKGNLIYKHEDQQKIEHDLLLESTILLVCDEAINNKSVSNHSAAGLVGMCVGNPELVRDGLNSFNKTINGWYLPDGTTSESAFYGLMTLGGIWDMAHAARGYSDPSGYIDSKGSRIDSLDLYHQTDYGNVLDAIFKGQQGDLYFPPYADSFRKTSLDVSYVELMVANYPQRGQYLSLLKELCGSNLSVHSGSVKDADANTVETYEEPVLKLPYDLTKPVGYSSFSFYYRKPGIEKKASPELKLPDWAPPELRIGHMRTGHNGRESLLLLSASHWANHHDIDSLNIYYWKKGQEVLSDLGYLWDHPHKPQNKRTVAHNTVVIDEKDQLQKERGGNILFFKTSERLKAMEVSSNAYQEAKLYRRTSAIIDHGNGRNYVVDFFRVEGGDKQDYVFHASNSVCETHDLELQASGNLKLYDFKNIRSADAENTWKATWKNGDMNCVAWSVSKKGEHVYVADGWGQRDWKNSDIGATIPYIVRRCKGSGPKLFISVFEGYDGTVPFVRNVKLIDQKGTIEVETNIGTDHIMSAMDSGTLKTGMGKGSKNLTAHFAVVSLQNKIPVWDFVVSDDKR